MVDIVPLSDEQIRGIFARAGFGSVSEVQKIEVGFMNNVYDVDGRYILKSGKWTESENSLAKEIYLCNLVTDIVPAPKILYADESRSYVDRTYIIYEKIEGANLYMRWHEYTNVERKEITRQMCDFQRAINKLSYDEYVSKFKLTVPYDWEHFIVARINEQIEKVKAESGLPPDLEKGIRAYVAQHSSVLKESNIVLSYVDPHFDNFIVRNSKIVGMLDFESMNVRSIDWVLHLVARMEQEPTKYASEDSKKFITPEDHSHLLDWYREFYPEAFAFSDMNLRLKIYAIKHNLSDLVGWSHVEMLRENIRKIVF